MTGKNYDFHQSLTALAVAGALDAVAGSGGACAADVVVRPEKAAIRLSAVDDAARGKFPSRLRDGGVQWRMAA